MVGLWAERLAECSAETLDDLWVALMAAYLAVLTVVYLAAMMAFQRAG